MFVERDDSDEFGGMLVEHGRWTALLQAAFRTRCRVEQRKVSDFALATTDTAVAERLADTLIDLLA